MAEPALDRGISVVVPVYNGGAVLEQLVASLHAALDPLYADYELILVDDGSEDETWPLIAKLARAGSGIRGIRLARNYGQHNALLAGIRAATREITVTIDADLQYPSDQIPELVAKLDEGWDVVYGTAGRRTEGYSRRVASWLARRLLRRAMRVRVSFSSFRAFRTNLRDGFARFGGPYVSIDVLLSWSTVRYASIPVEQASRTSGRSSYSPRKLASLALTMLTGFTTLPLRLASLVGFAFTLVGFGLLAFVIVEFLIVGRQVPGFAFLASIIAIFAGAQLFALGIIGEYLARVHMRVLDPPTYAVREELP
jgi:undecaprenyl-phosphate 4-deoxy-4-formamido-L-arabinose transferase